MVTATAEIILPWFGIIAALLFTLKHGKHAELVRFPFIFSVVHLLYIFPKVLSFALSSEDFVGFYARTGALRTIALMSVGCYFAGLLGYYSYRKRSFESTAYLLTSNDQTRLLVAVLLIGSVSFTAFVMLVMLAGGGGAFLSGEGYYSLSLEGPVVWLLFVARFIYLAIAGCALAVATQRPDLKYRFLLLVLTIYPAINIFALYRRSDLIFLGFIALYALILKWRSGVPRIVALAFFLIPALLTSVFPILRTELAAEGTYSRVQELDSGLPGIASNFFEVKINSEVAASAARISKVDDSGQYGLLLFVYNSVIQQYVPAGLVGRERKESLFISPYERKEAAESVFDFSQYFYLAPMGFTEAYEQLSWLGIVIFFFLGWFCTRLERNRDTFRGAIFYMAAMPYVVLSATNDFTSVPPKILAIWLLCKLFPARRWRKNSFGAPMKKAGPVIVNHDHAANR